MRLLRFQKLRVLGLASLVFIFLTPWPSFASAPIRCEAVVQAADAISNSIHSPSVQLAMTIQQRAKSGIPLNRLRVPELKSDLKVMTRSLVASDLELKNDLEMAPLRERLGVLLKTANTLAQEKQGPLLAEYNEFAAQFVSLMGAITDLKFGQFLGLPPNQNNRPISIAEALIIADSSAQFNIANKFMEQQYPNFMFIFVPRELSIRDFNAIYDRGVFFIGVADRLVSADNRMMSPITFARHDFVHSAVFLQTNFSEVFKGNRSITELSRNFIPSESAFSYIRNRLKQIETIKSSFFEAASEKDCPVDSEFIQEVWFYISHETGFVISWDKIELLSKKILSLNNDQLFRRGADKFYFDPDIGPHLILVDGLKERGYSSDEAIRDNLDKAFRWLEPIAARERLLSE
jgi:hypothetical protein